MTLSKTKPKRATPTHRRRSGQHHRKGQSYLKTYWPYIPIMTVLGLGIVSNNYLAHIHHNVLGYSTDISAQTLLNQTNIFRQQDKEPSLTLNNALAAAAQAKANDMVKRNYWSHVTPDGKQPWTFIAANGYQYGQAGENLAYGFGTSSQVLTAWMHSKEHATNILNSNFTEVGFATADSPNYRSTGPETIIVAFYAQPAGSAVSLAHPALQVSNTAQTISRIGLTNGARWGEIALAALCGGAIAAFFIRHSLAWRKVLIRGEQLVLHHPFLDLFLISLVVVSLVLSRTIGSIL